MIRFNLRKQLALATMEILDFGQGTTHANIRRYVVPRLSKYRITAKIEEDDIFQAQNIIFAVCDQKPISFRYGQDLRQQEARRDAIEELTEEVLLQKMALRKTRASRHR